MKSLRQIVPGVLALALCGTVAAHNISADGWNPLFPSAVGTGTSITLNPPSLLPEGISLAGITSLSFSPGTGLSNPANGSYEEFTRVTNNDPLYATADEWEWGGGGITQQTVSLTATSTDGSPMLMNAPVLTISVGFADYDYSPNSVACGSIIGETASVSVNGNTYTAKNPCQLAAGTGDLTFVNGVLKAGTGVGWTLTSTVQAPELDSASAGGGLSLLLGGLLVLRGRQTGLRTGLFG